MKDLTCMDFADHDQNGCVNCRLKSKSLLNQLPNSDLETLDSHRKQYQLKKGDIIFKEGSKPTGIICLRKGRVKITKLGVEGIEQIVGLRKPVDFIGYKSLIAEKKHTTSATAIDDCTICIIDKSDFLNVVKNNSGLALKLLNSFANELIESDKRIVNLTQKHMRGRMAEALLLLKDVYGLEDDGLTLVAQLKRSELGSLSNMTSSNAIRVISAFAKEEIIELDQRKIKIINEPKLNNISKLNL